MCENNSKYVNSELCRKCGGVCCKTMGCHFSPDDFTDLSFDGLKAEIEKGHISIDWWEAEAPIFFLRIRNRCASVVDPSWGGICVLLTATGCPLSFEKRPKGGRTLIPKEGLLCEGEYSKEECANDWQPHGEILEELRRYFITKE